MIARLQKKTGLAIGAAWDIVCLDYLNEAFRKLNQNSKGGFVWQVKSTNLSVPAVQGFISLPADFDPGKDAWLIGNSTTATSTVIPYVPWKDWVNEEGYQVTGVGLFSSWTFRPNFTGAPATYAYVAEMAPASAFGAAPFLRFMYHAVNFPPLANGANIFFPTPDQFDSLIVDLALAEMRNVYRLSGDQLEMQTTMQAVNEIIDTYRTDRYNLAGLSDQLAQAQEKQTTGAR
jgi:hypothetical protein